MAIDKGSYVIVQSGDTLSEIVETYVKTGEDLYSVRIPRIAKINGIEDVNKIVVGQKIKLVEDTSTSSTSKSTSYKPTIKAFGLVSKDSTRQVYVSWKFDHNNVDHYKIDWIYATGVGTGFVSSSTVNGTDAKQSLYSAPEEATKVKVRITPVAKTYKQKTKNGKEVESPYWKGTQVTSEIYHFSNNPPEEISGLEVTLENLQLTATVKNVDAKRHGDIIQFELHQGDEKNGFQRKGSQKIAVSSGSASWVKTVWSGSEYRVRCRAFKSVTDEYGQWSEFVGDYATAPAVPAGFTKCIATDNEDNKDKVTKVELEWSAVNTATSYEIEYSTDKSLLGVSETNKKELSNGELAWIFDTLEPGSEYFFRIRAKNEAGTSDWSEISSAKVGAKPASPTTWSSETTVICNDKVSLYWIHNAENEDYPIKSELYLTSDGNVISVSNFEPNHSASNETCEFTLNLADYNFPSGTKLMWKIRTQGVAGTWSEWSAERLIRVYDKPKLEIELQTESDYKPMVRTEYHLVESVNMKDASGNDVYVDYGEVLIVEPSKSTIVEKAVCSGKPVYSGIDTTNNVTIYYCEVEVSTLVSFPFYLYAAEVTDSTAETVPKPIGYHVSVISNEYYETTDDAGEIKMVKPGDAVYSKFVDELLNDDTRSILVEFSAGNIDLENSISYTVSCTVSMDSGLTDTQTCEFTVDWTDELYTPNAVVSINEEDYSALIKPFCTDADGNFPDDVTLSVFRREYDGTFVSLAKGISNTNNSHVVDPHPGLDYARYRIVAVDSKTGSMSYYDIPGVYIGGHELVLQWDEEWKKLETEYDGTIAFVEEPSWSGSVLKLPYNIDISDSYNPDVELIEYIGRANPVSYYGTQVGETRNINFDIIKDDAETIYALRRLGRWMGDVYVREPSGSGYWANVAVSFNQTHMELVVPVTLKISRVEGGV